MSDKATSIALNPAAPGPERFDAQAELQKAHTPTLASELLPAESVRGVIEWINNDLVDQEFQKSLRRNIVPFPSKAAIRGQPGMQSIWLDDRQVAMMGESYEKPRSEERRVGKECVSTCRSRGPPYHIKKKTKM